jgi:carboxypeptidase C (cathepsin A)
MLYVDSPIGTGFSYSEKPMSDDVFRASIPENLFLALGDFRNKFKSFAGA